MLIDKPFITAHIIPTSIGASFGGFAGDATPCTNLLAAVSDVVITHPNVVNASDLYDAKDNVLYVEGYLLDQFFLKKLNLRRVRNNRIGVIIDKTQNHFIDHVVNSINAAVSVMGIDMVGFVVTEQEIKPRVKKMSSGIYTGVIDNPKTLIKAASHLICKGATAIAITMNILDVPDISDYLKGNAPNPHGGVEAILSHLVSCVFLIPAAHAPMYTLDREPHYGVVDAREAAELVTTTAIACVFKGLHRSPQPVRPDNSITSDISLNDLSALVCPYNCLGGIPMLSCEKNNIPIIAVKQNTTILNVSPENIKFNNVHVVDNYLECIGLLLAIKNGINHKSLQRPLLSVKEIVDE